MGKREVKGLPHLCLVIHSVDLENHVLIKVDGSEKPVFS